MAELTDNEIKFMRGLEKLTRETGIAIGGCGECGSPWLTKLKETELDPRAGYGFRDLADIDYVSWIDPSESDWEEYGDTVIK